MVFCYGLQKLETDRRDASLQRLLDCSQSPSSIKLFVAALGDLWERQKAMGMNNYPSPRTKAINSILRAIDHVRKCSSDTQF